MHPFVRLALIVCLLPTTAPAAELSPLSCTLDRTCILGKPCSVTSDAFQLDPTEGGYSATIDSDRVDLLIVSPAEASVKTFVLSSPQSVTLLLSVFPDGQVVLTTQEDIDGPHVETSTGRCVEEM